MGQSIHPILQRLGFSRTWNFKVNNFKNFDYINHFDICKKIEKYINLYFNKKNIKNLGFLYSHSSIKISLSSVNIDVFLYQSVYDYLFQYVNTDQVRDFFAETPSADFFKMIGVQSNIQPENVINKSKFYFRDREFNSRFISIFLQAKFEAHLARSIKKDFKFLNVNVKFYNVRNEKITGAILNQFIKNRLRRKYKMLDIINSITNEYFPKSDLEGLFVICKGRYTKQQRASNDVFKKGKLALSGIYNGSFLDYSINPLKLKYGICAIKIVSSYK